MNSRTRSSTRQEGGSSANDGRRRGELPTLQEKDAGAWQSSESDGGTQTEKMSDKEVYEMALTLAKNGFESDFKVFVANHAQAIASGGDILLVRASAISMELRKVTKQYCDLWDKSCAMSEVQRVEAKMDMLGRIIEVNNEFVENWRQRMEELDDGEDDNSRGAGDRKRELIASKTSLFETDVVFMLRKVGGQLVKNCLMDMLDLESVGACRFNHVSSSGLLLNEAALLAGQVRTALPNDPLETVLDRVAEELVEVVTTEILDPDKGGLQTSSVATFFSANRLDSFARLIASYANRHKISSLSLQEDDDEEEEELAEQEEEEEEKEKKVGVREVRKGQVSHGLFEREPEHAKRSQKKQEQADKGFVDFQDYQDDEPPDLPAHQSSQQHQHQQEQRSAHGKKTHRKRDRREDDEDDDDDDGAENHQNHRHARSKDKDRDRDKDRFADPDPDPDLNTEPLPSPPKTPAENPFKIYRQRVKWTDEEEAALMAGMARHYRSKQPYADILADKKFRVLQKNRTNVSLKDKFFNLLANGKDFSDYAAYRNLTVPDKKKRKTFHKA